MAISFHEYDRYSIKGKIIDVNDRSSTLIISVTSPFASEIEFNCSSDHYDMLHPATFKYTWISWVQGAGHPNETEAAAYYNKTHKCFYKKEYGSESEWERTDFEDIYDDNPNLLSKNLNMQEKYKFFLYRYMSILHKEQLCRFSAYAIEWDNRSWRSIKNKQVERHPDDYDWIYDPDTFHGEKWDAESIDGLVKEIRPSRDCVEWLIESYKTEDQEAKRKDKKEKRENKKNKWKNRFDRFEQYPNTIKIIITVLITTFVNQIPAIFKALKYIVQLIRG